MKIVDIFAGAGGLGLGLSQAGFEIAIAIDNDKTACETYRKNHPHTTVRERDIRKVSGKEIKAVTGKDIILAGGPPCQSWTQMKEGCSDNGIKDPRGQLLYEYMRIVKELQPIAIIFENVPYLVSGEHIKEFKMFKDELLKVTNLKLEYKILNSFDFGVAQKRERLILIGVNPNTKNPLNLIKPILGPRTLKDQLRNCPDSESSTFNRRGEEIIKQIPPGKCWNVLPTDKAISALGNDYRAICNHCKTSFKPQYGNCPKCGKKDFRNGYGVTSYWRRLAWDRPCYTICAVGTTKPHGSLAHPEEHRGLSIRECARLQGFPDDYEFCGPIHEQYRQIGNAVTVSVGKAIGLALNEAFGLADSVNWIQKFIKHPQKDKLHALERDFLNIAYQKAKKEEPFPVKYEEYFSGIMNRLDKLQA